MGGSIQDVVGRSFDLTADPAGSPYVFDPDDSGQPWNEQTEGQTFAQVLAARSGASAPTSATTTSAHTLTGFAAGSQPQKRDVTFARLAADVYQAGGRDAEGWHRMSDDEIRAHGLDPTNLHDDKAHFRAAIYTDEHGHYAVAFRGTDPESVQDWKTNYRQAFGMTTRAYKDARDLGAIVTTKLGADNVVMVGHSLGGGEADEAALAGGCSAVTFNAAGLSDTAIRAAGWTPSDARRAMQSASRSYTIDGEVLTGLQENSDGVLPTAMGHEIHLADPEPGQHPDATPMFMPGFETFAPSFVIQHSVWLHGMRTVIESMEKDPRLLH